MNILALTRGSCSAVPMFGGAEVTGYPLKGNVLFGLMKKELGPMTEVNCGFAGLEGLVCD